jgi:hypothetical protein
MKRLIILSIVALLATATGCRTCSSWWNRGDSCDTCGGEPISTYSSGTLIAPPGNIIVPGPVESLPPG